MRDRALFDSSLIRQRLLRQTGFCAEVVKPCAIGITGVFWFSAHNNIIRRNWKAIAF